MKMGKYYTDCGAWMINKHPRILRLIQQDFPGEYNNAIAGRYSPTEDR